MLTPGEGGGEESLVGQGLETQHLPSLGRGGTEEVLNTALKTLYNEH